MTDWMFAPDDDPFINWPDVPEHLRAGLVAYVKHGQPTGDFLRAVLVNDLSEALARADGVSTLALQSIAGWIYNEAPSPCWGSEEEVAAWLASHKALDAEAYESGPRT